MPVQLDLFVAPEPVLPSDFKGSTYDAAQDEARLNEQQQRVYAVVKGGEWWTLAEIADFAEAPEASVSARLRDLRRIGRTAGWAVEGRRRREGRGTWEYRLVRT